MSSRHISRIAAFQALFAADERGDMTLPQLMEAREKNAAALPKGDEDAIFTDALLKGVAAKRAEIDAIIEKGAPEWPLARIAPIDRNVLRIGLFELLYGDQVSVPPKVALNEAIELAKSFGGDTSGKFVNGVLGGVYADVSASAGKE